jgi:hypothetical protein
MYFCILDSEGLHLVEVATKPLGYRDYANEKLKCYNSDKNATTFTWNHVKQ